MPALFFTSYVGLALITIGALMIFLQIDQEDHRISLTAFILKYIGVVLLLYRIFSTQILLSILLTGVMSSSILATDQIEMRTPLKLQKFTATVMMRLLLGLILLVLILSIEPRIAVWLPVPDSILFGALYLVIMGLAEISLTSSLMVRFLGMLSILLGFQMVYILLEESVLVFAFMVGLSLLTALLGAFFMSTIPKPSEQQPTDEEYTE